MSKLGRELKRLAFEAIALAVDCFAAGEHNPFILFVDASGQTQLIDVKDAGGNITRQLVEEARRIVSQSIPRTAKRYAIAYDGYLTIDGERTDAAFVEAAERGDREAVLIAQRYRVKKRSKKPERIGSPTIVAPAEQLGKSG
jgi:hypothetical protein